MEGSLAENLSTNFNLGVSHAVFGDFETNEILDTLQTISFVMDIPTLSMADKKAVSKAVYNTEHKLLSMEHAQGEPSVYQECQIAPLSYAFTLAALLYLELIIREHPFISKVYHRITSKLHKLLRDSSTAWYGFGLRPHQDVVLWITYVKALASPPGATEDFSAAFPGNVEMEEDMKESLRRRLRGIAWRDETCDFHLDRIWREMSNRPGHP